MQTFLTVTEYRHAFNPPLPRDATYKLLKSKRVRSIRLGMRYLIPAEEVERFVNAELGAN